MKKAKKNRPNKRRRAEIRAAVDREQQLDSENDAVSPHLSDKEYFEQEADEEKREKKNRPNKRRRAELAAAAAERKQRLDIDDSDGEKVEGVDGDDEGR